MKKTDTLFFHEKIEAGGFQVTKSKLVKPKIKDQFVLRLELIKCLENGQVFPLTLVSAATGFGKSILVSQWLEEFYHAYGWLSLDKEHNHVQVFLTYVLTAIKASFPDRSFESESLIGNEKFPSSLIISTLINDLDSLKDHFTLVLDDYHVIHNAEIHEILNGIINYPPENFHLVLITQKDPPLKLARMRAQSRINELRMRDLVFSPEDSLALGKSFSQNIEEEIILKLAKHADGWVTGLTAGLIGLAKGFSFEKVIDALNKPNSVISDLLDEVVIQNLGLNDLKFLILSSLPDRFSIDLVYFLVESIGDEKLTRESIEDVFTRSKQRNLFLIPLDESDTWFRYHHFFQGEIRKKAFQYYSKEEIANFLVLISQWFEKKGELDDALHYAIQSDKMDTAVAIFARVRYGLINSEQYLRLERLIDKFPEQTLEKYPELLITKAFLDMKWANIDKMLHCLILADELLTKSPNENPEYQRQLIGECHSIFAFLSYMKADLKKAIFHGEQSMELLSPDSQNYFREFGLGWFAFAQQALGNIDQGVDRLEKELSQKAALDAYFRNRLLQGKCMIYLMDANVNHLYFEGSELAMLSSPSSSEISWLTGVYSQTCSYYLTNQLDKATQFHDEVWRYRYFSRHFWVLQQLILECLAELAQGHFSRVEKYIKDFEEFGDELRNSNLIGIIWAFKTEIFLRCGEIEHAIEASFHANFEPYPPVYHYFIPQLTKAKLLYWTQREKEGQPLLKNLLELGRSRSNYNLLIQALSLQTAVHVRAGNLEKAVESFQEALALTSRDESVRNLLEGGADLEQIVWILLGNQPKNQHLIKLSRCFEKNGKVTNCKPTKLAPSQDISLSGREMEILKLVVQGFRNNEIAEKLFVSLDTVKKHLYRAYQKLQVKNRVSAIKKIKMFEVMDSI